MSAWRRRYDALDCARPSPARVAELRAALLLALVDEHGPEVAEVARRFIDGELVEKVTDDQHGWD